MKSDDSIYEKQFVIETSQCDVKGSWRLSAALEAMQITANEHCRLLQIGRNDLEKAGLLWVLFRTDIEWNRYPRIGETVTIKTFMKGMNLKFFPRYFVFCDQNGATIGKAGSLWMMIDQITRKSVSAKDYGFEIPNADLEAPIRIAFVENKVKGATRSTQYAPQYSDFDANGHVSNVRYADWLCNNLGLVFMNENDISFASIVYRNEILPGNIVKNSFTVSDHEFRFSGYVDGKQFFDIYGITAELSL